jgi:hypothetical protein
MRLMDIMENERDGRFSVASYPGVAFYCWGEETKPDEDTEWSGYEIPTGKVVMTMVGDDREFIVDPDDVTLIAENDYCPGCGQIGCKAYGRN